MTTPQREGRTFNVAGFLPRAAQEQPQGVALLHRRGNSYASVTFADLDAMADSFAHGLRRHGLAQGMRVLMMVKSSPEFVALTFAVFKIGALPVLIDPGMGLKGMLACIRHLEPEALIGIPAAHVIRFLFPSCFRSVRHAVSVGRFGLLGATSLARLSDPKAGPFPMTPTRADDDAAILFTSGSTGPAKGVVYRHGIFEAQVAALRQMYHFAPGQVDMPGFPLFALFSTALGVTCLLPELNPSRPATANPALLVRAIQERNVTSAQGSPAIWTRVGQYCKERGIHLPSLKRVITFGAPISVDLVRTWREILPADGDIHTPYGATEALPITTVSGREILEEAAALTEQGAGTLIGRAAPGMEIRIIRITDDAIPEWRADLVLPPGEIGEVVVAGEVVTWRYDRREEATRLAKIREGKRIWHRMGDVGYFDAMGRLWFCGRKAHRVEGPGGRTWFSVNAEGMIDTHPDVYRAALVGVGLRGNQEPVLVVELMPGRGSPGAGDRDRLSAELLGRVAGHPLYCDIKKVLYHTAFPVDPRHNAKIHREDLAVWASEQLGQAR